MPRRHWLRLDARFRHELDFEFLSGPYMTFAAVAFCRWLKNADAIFSNTVEMASRRRRRRVTHGMHGFLYLPRREPADAARRRRCRRCRGVDCRRWAILLQIQAYWQGHVDTTPLRLGARRRASPYGDRCHDYSRPPARRWPSQKHGGMRLAAKPAAGRRRISKPSAAFCQCATADASAALAATLIRRLSAAGASAPPQAAADMTIPLGACRAPS